MIQIRDIIHVAIALLSALYERYCIHTLSNCPSDNTKFEDFNLCILGLKF